MAGTRARPRGLTRAQEIDRQRAWIDARGGSMHGYILHYERVGVPSDQAAAIYQADRRRLAKISAGQARDRPFADTHEFAPDLHDRQRCARCGAPRGDHIAVGVQAAPGREWVPARMAVAGRARGRGLLGRVSSRAARRRGAR
jgi:hypothetical protein